MDLLWIWILEVFRVLTGGVNEDFRAMGDDADKDENKDLESDPESTTTSSTSTALLDIIASVKKEKAAATPAKVSMDLMDIIAAVKGSSKEPPADLKKKKEKKLISDQVWDRIL